MPRLMRCRALPLCAVLCLPAMLGTPLAAQDTDLTDKLMIELNSAEQTATSGDGAQACTLSFVITNGLPSDLESLIIETVLFDASGSVNRLMLFDFAALPKARPRVRQFSVPGLPCDQIGQILMNGVQSCTGVGVETATCARAITTATRTDIEVLG